MQFRTVFKLLPGATKGVRGAVTALRFPVERFTDQLLEPIGAPTTVVSATTASPSN